MLVKNKKEEDCVYIPRCFESISDEQGVAVTFEDPAVPTYTQYQLTYPQTLAEGGSTAMVETLI